MTQGCAVVIVGNMQIAKKPVNEKDRYYFFIITIIIQHRLIDFLVVQDAVSIFDCIIAPDSIFSPLSAV